MHSLLSPKKFVTPLYILLVGVFFVYYFRNIDFKKINDVKVNYPDLAIGIFLALAFRVWCSFTWSRLLKMLGVKKFRFVDSNYVYAKSWLGRYIPGKIMWILGKVYFASEHGVPKAKLAVSALIESGVQVMVALILGIGLVVIFDMSQIDTEIKILMGFVSVGLIISLLPPLFNKFMKLAYKFIKKRDIGNVGYDGRVLAAMIGFFLVASIISGSSYYYCVSAVTVIDSSYFFYLIGTSNLAGALGVLAIVAPSGIGIREGVQFVLLQQTFSNEALAIVLVVTRLISTLADILYYFGSLASARFLR